MDLCHYSNYSISLPNPVGDHVKVADLYEDMLPNTGKYNNTSITLEERFCLFISSYFILFYLIFIAKCNCQHSYQIHTKIFKCVLILILIFLLGNYKF